MGCKQGAIVAALAFAPLFEAVATEQKNNTEPVRLEEVTVTSQRYEQPLKEVPVSVHVIDGEQIDRAQVRNMADLSQSVPNLVIGEGAINTNIFIRGIGSGTNRAFEQSVGMFIDEVYMGRGHQFRSPLLDLQQVDVLRGPQGALFGKNTIAGAAVVTTRKPDLNGDLEATFSADIEPEYGGRTLVTALASPLGDRWAMRFVNKTAHHDGYWVNTAKADADEQDIDESINRLSLRFAPRDNWLLDAKYERVDFDAAGSTIQIRHLQPLTPLAGLLTAAAYAADPRLDTELNRYRSTENFGRDEYRNQQVDNGLFRAAFESASFDLTYTLGYSAFEVRESQDVDYLPIEFIGLDDERDFDQWSQELRLQRQFSDTLNVQGGIYWQDQNLDGNFQEHLGLPALGPLWDGLFAANGIDPAVFPPTPFTRNTAYQQQAETWALFAEADWQFAERWHLLLGGRFNREEKTFERMTSEDEFLNPGTPAPLAAHITAQFFNVQVLTPSFEGERTERDFLPSFKLRWDVTDNTNSYFKIERGAKSGGFNAVADSAPGDQEYDDEQAITYELGSKSLLWDDRVSLNAALFHTEVKDLQVTVLNGPRFLVGNAAESISQGVELDGAWRINGEWNLSYYAAWLDAYYSDFNDGPCRDIDIVAGKTVCDKTGETTPFSPEWSGGVQLDYRTVAFTGVDFVAGLGVSYSDDYLINAKLDPIDSQSSYTKFDAQLGLEADHWELALIGKNLSDETLVSYSLETPLLFGGHAALMQPPRTYVLRMRLKL